jgi:hypothetical protein
MANVPKKETEIVGSIGLTKKVLKLIGRVIIVPKEVTTEVAWISLTEIVLKEVI